jgi:hypothetical protein
LTLRPTDISKVGNRSNIDVVLSTPDVAEGLKESFVFEVAPPSSPSRSPHGEVKERGAGLALPQIREVERDGWEKFGFDEDDVVSIERDKTTESFVNMDNAALLRFCYANAANSEVHKHQYKVAATVLGLAIESLVDKEEMKPEDARNALRSIGRVVLPLINTLGSIDE